MADTKPTQTPAAASTPAPKEEAPKAETKEATPVADPNKSPAAGDQVGAPVAADPHPKDREGQPDKPKTYVLKEGKTHDAIVRGERITLKEGDELELSPEQYASFKDKFEPKGSDNK